MILKTVFLELHAIAG